MSGTINLLRRSIDNYNDFKNKDFVVNPSLPILYFGDLNAYLKSKFKVITSALNPSDLEFKRIKTDKPNFDRFPDYDFSINSLQIALNNYFKINPYQNWFGVKNISKKGFLPVLNGLDTCYYEDIKQNTALHTDICSPIATNPTWAGLSKKQKELLKTEGFKLWKDLVKELKPDLVLISTKRDYLNELPVRFIKTVNSKFSKTKKIEYQINHYRIKLKNFETNLIWGSAQNTPLQPFKNKYQLGIDLKKYLISYQKRHNE